MTRLHPELCEQTPTPATGTLVAYGSAGVGRRGLVESWARRHVAGGPGVANPDILRLHGTDGKPATAAESRAFVNALRMAGEHGRRCGLVPDADDLGPQASAALLKLTEEPTEGTLLLLTARAPASLPPALLSRAHRIRVPVPDPGAATQWLKDASPDHKDEANGLLQLVDGRPGAALEIIAQRPLEIYHDICRLVAPVARGKPDIDRNVMNTLAQNAPRIACDLLVTLSRRTAQGAAGVAPAPAIPGEDKLLNALAGRLGAGGAAGFWHAVSRIAAQRDRQYLDPGRAFVRAAGQLSAR